MSLIEEQIRAILIIHVLEYANSNLQPNPKDIEIIKKGSSITFDELKYDSSELDLFYNLDSSDIEEELDNVFSKNTLLRKYVEELGAPLAQSFGNTTDRFSTLLNPELITFTLILILIFKV
ncbi:MAG: hypothetical protein ABIG93_02510 [archaeon]|nr:hypothetical protein [Nanoarchaeota archaeon]